MNPQSNQRRQNKNNFFNPCPCAQDVVSRLFCQQAALSGTGNCIPVIHFHASDDGIFRGLIGPTAPRSDNRFSATDLRIITFGWAFSRWDTNTVGATYKNGGLGLLFLVYCLFCPVLCSRSSPLFSVLANFLDFFVTII